MAERMFIIDQLPSVSPETQKFFQDIADYVIPLLENGRPFDLKHTFATAYWAGQICIQENLDPEILIPAALFHDTGWTALFNSNDGGSRDFDKIQDKKKQHMINSENITRKYLEKHPQLSKSKRLQILFIIRNHDEIDKVELIRNNIYLNALVEADTLGQIDLKRVTITFNKENLKKFISDLLGRRELLFYSEFGKRSLEQLLDKLYKYYESM